METSVSNITVEYSCVKCNKKYKNRCSLWKHNKKYHNDNDKAMISNDKDVAKSFDKYSNLIEKKTYDCSKCEKKFMHYQSRWTHEKSCTKDSKKIEENIIINQLIELKEQINKLEKKTNKKFINNGTIVNAKNTNNINNSNNTNKLIINKPGTENVLELNDYEITNIFNKEIEGVMQLIEFINFNERLPSNHSFCTTALESPYLSTYNTETNTVDKDRKKYFFDTIFSNAIERHEFLYKNNKNKFNAVKKKQIEDNILNLKRIKNYDLNNRIVKEIMKKLNLLSYNKRNIIQRTWSKNPDNDDSTDDDYFANLTNEDNELKYVEVYEDDIPFLKIKENGTSSEIPKLLPSKKIDKKHSTST